LALFYFRFFVSYLKQKHEEGQSLLYYL